MIVLDWLTLPLLLASVLCFTIKSIKLQRIWHTRPSGQYWVLFIFIACVLLIGIVHKSRIVGLALGLLSPSSVILPTLLAVYLYTSLPQTTYRFGFKWYDVLFLSSLQLILILSSWTVLPWDIYRLGYLPYSAFIALLLICYTYLRQLDILTVIFTLGLLLWALGIGSNNYFDWIQHTFVLIFAWAWLFMQLLIRIGRRLNLH